MNETIKILIGYDGSDCADVAIDGLARAGLPHEAQATIVSVAETWLPSAPDESANTSGEDAPRSHTPAAVQAMYERGEQRLEAARQLAARGEERLRALFPGWSVSSEAAQGSPAWALIAIADERRPDLIVVGSTGRNALGRFVLGSVSQRVLAESSCAVRIARRNTGAGGSGERIVIAVDGSPGAHKALLSVAKRRWTPGSELRIVIADTPPQIMPLVELVPSVDGLVKELNDADRARADRLANDAVESLRAEVDNQDVTVTAQVLNGDPKRIIVKHAEEFGADCIFTGAAGWSAGFVGSVERLLLGSVSSAIATRAHCSVEVVRGAAR